MGMTISTENIFRILIVDDETLVCWSLSKALSEKGYVVSTAQTAQDALRLMKKTEFNLVIVDLKLPDLNGIDLLREVKKECPRCKVFMISAFGTPQVREEALKEGALRFIDKPFDIEDVRESVRFALFS